MRAAVTVRHSAFDSITSRALLAFTLAMTVPCAQPQSLVDSGTATLTGTVVDTTGVVIPKAILSLEKTDGLLARTTTDSNGHFAIETSSGEYILRASAPGFETYNRSIHLTAATPITQNVTLSVGTIRCGLVIEGNSVTSINASLDLLLPVNSLPPLDLSNKTSKHLKK